MNILCIFSIVILSTTLNASDQLMLPAQGTLTLTLLKCSSAGCSRLFTKKAHLDRHQKAHNPTLFRCKSCGFTYHTPNGLKAHTMGSEPRKVKPCEVLHKKEQS